MDRMWILAIVFGLCAIRVQGVLNMCTSLPPVNEVNWAKLKRGPWKWAIHTSDTIQDMLKCSNVYIHGSRKGDSQNFTMEFENKYGGLYVLSGSHEAQGEYHITEFKVEIARKGNVMFYTNYRNYFISATCMPNGRVSVAAFTRHRKIRRKLLNMIYNVLAKHRVMAIPMPSYCL